MICVFSFTYISMLYNVFKLFLKHKFYFFSVKLSLLNKSHYLQLTRSHIVCTVNSK